MVSTPRLVEGTILKRTYRQAVESELQHEPPKFQT